MNKSIYFPASVCPLHLGHEDLIKTVQDNSGKEIYYSIKAGEKTLKAMIENNTNGILDNKISGLLEQENFLTLNNRYKILENIFPNSNIGNEIRSEVIGDEFDGIVMGSDIFNRIVKSIEIGKKTSFKFEKIYLYERVGYNIKKYIDLFRKNNINTEIILLGKSKIDVTGGNIRKKFYDGGLDGIKKYVSKDVFDLIKEIKKN